MVHIKTFASFTTGLIILGTASALNAPNTIGWLQKQKNSATNHWKAADAVAVPTGSPDPEQQVSAYIPDRARGIRGGHARHRGRSYRHTHKTWYSEHHTHSEHHSHSSSTYRGRATWYAVGQGACGMMSSPHEHIVALNKPQYEAQGYSVSSQACFREVTITNENNGKTATAKVVDMCEGCNDGSLDMSAGIFQELAGAGGLGEGTFPITWAWASDDDSGDDGDDGDESDS